MDCIFCKIIKKEIPSKVIYESDSTLAFMDVFPNDEGHVLVIPKEHHENFYDTPQDICEEIVKTKKIVVKLIKEKLNPVGFNFVSNMGSEAHQVVFHYHEHIIPKYNKEIGYKPSVNRSDKQKTVDEVYEILIN